MSSASTRIKVLKGGALIDGKGGSVAGRSVVIVEGDRIKAVGPESQVEVPVGAEVDDFGSCTLMPGLIDAHLHIAEFNPISFQNHRAARIEVSPQLQMLYAMFHAQVCLEMGFTALRDMGAATIYHLNVPEMVALREAINAGIVAGPRLVVGGWANITGSHLDLILPRAYVRHEGVMADGPWELRKLSRQHLRTGADFIKSCLSGGGGTDNEEPDIRNMTQEEIDAVVDEAHAFNKRCAIHCFTADAQKRAMKAGVDTIEHCVWTDDEAIEQMLATNKILVPTLAHRTDRAIELRRSTGTPDFVLNKLRKLQPYCKETFQRLHAAGVKIAMGTDTQLDPEMGANALELEIYVDFGMTPMEAIMTATANGAEALGLAKQTGTLETGKWADVIAVDGDPLTDIKVLQSRQRIRMVMKGGQICVDKRDGKTRRVIANDDWNQSLSELLEPRVLPHSW